MRTLIYKRTHKGDPDPGGCFGIYDCMGRLRRTDFDAVIGLGGMGREAQTARIAGKITWIGIGAHKTAGDGRGPRVTFDHFVLFDEKGKDLSDIAPLLARRFYLDHGPRFLLDGSLSKPETQEIERILHMARKEPPSKGMPRRET